MDAQDTGRQFLSGSSRDRRDELEDDRVVDRLGRDVGKGPVLQRVDRWSEGDTSDAEVSSAIDLIARGASGTSLPEPLRQRLEAELGIELRSVRIHDDEAAHRAATQLKARAFTVGDDIYFAEGAYQPHSAAGVELIAHEVAHVSQQRGSTSHDRTRVSEASDPHEREAHEFARRIAPLVSADTSAHDPARVVERARRDATRVPLPFQAELEERLGTSFDFVETYSGPAAQAACEALGAAAFVVRNIVMLADPSPQRELLLHELTHVEQMGRRVAPTAFAPGSLQVSRPEDAAEVEAAAFATASVAADPDTIHRAKTPPAEEDEASNSSKRIEYFVAYMKTKMKPYPKVNGEGENEYAFMNETTGYRFKKSSPEPWKRSDYLDVLTKKKGAAPHPKAVKEDQASKDIAEMTSADGKAKYGIANVTDNTYAFIESSKPVDKVKYIGPDAKDAPDVDAQFTVYFKVCKAAKKRLTGFKWKAFEEEYNEATRDYLPAEADAFRRAMRDKLVESYSALPGGGFEEFYDEIMNPPTGRIVPPKYNGLTGSIFEDLIETGTGIKLSGERPMFKSSKGKSLNESPRKADNSVGTTLCDAKAATSGAVKDQAEDYAKIVTPPQIRGWIKGEDPNKPTRMYDKVQYVVPHPDVGDKILGQLDTWFEDDKAARQRFSVSKSNNKKKGKKFKGKLNPEFEFETQETKKTSYTFKNPPSGIPGVTIKEATFTTTPDETKLTGGSITMAVDMEGAVKNDHIVKQLKPNEGGDGDSMGATAENKLTGFKSTLDKVLGAVEVDAKLIDEGAEATISLKKGAAKIPNFEIDDAKLTARYTGGTLSVEGEVGITHKSKKVSGKVKVGWNGKSWSFDGEASLAEGLVPGLSGVKLRVTYADGKTKIFCPKASYQHKFGAIDVTGTVSGIEYDVNEGSFSGDAELEADLGMFGKASGTATLTKNKLTKASLSYDSPELKYPKDKPVIVGTVGGTVKLDNGKFSGDIRGTADLKIAALQKIAKEGIGLSVDAHIGEDGSYSGSIKSTKAITIGKHLKIPSVGLTLEKDGSLKGDFEIEIVNIKGLKTAKAKGTVDKSGVHIESAEATVEFGDKDKGKFWGSITAKYTDEKGFDVEGTANYKIKDDIIATGTIKYSQETNAIGVELKVSEITLFDKSIHKDLFSASKQIPVVNIYGLGIYIDIGFDLGFDFGFKLTMTPSAKVEDFSLDTMEYKRISAKLEVGGDIYAQLTGTPKLGIGVFAIDPSIIRGGGGLKVPIVGRLDVKPKATFDVGYSPDGGADASAKLGISGEFGIKGSVKPYAEFALLNNLWNPKWEGEALAEFEILKPTELFNFTVDLNSKEKQEDPALPGKNETKAPREPEGDKKAKAEAKAPVERGGGAGKTDAKQGEVPEGGDQGPFSLDALMEKLKAIPGFATAKKIFEYGQKIWKVVKPIWDLFEPLMDIIIKRIEEVIDLFDPPPSLDNIGGFLWKLAKLLFNLSFGGLSEIASAIKSLLGKAAAFAKKLINKAVQDGHIGVKRHSYYIWMPWPKDDIEFMAAAEWKINIPGVANLGQGGPPGFLLSPSGAVSLVLYEALQAVGIGYTYVGNSDINRPYNDIWTGAGARG